MRKSLQVATTALLSALLSCPAGFALRTTGGVESRSAMKEFMKQLHEPEAHLNIGLGYWIELIRGDKRYRCNNKIEFQSGDQIRFHVVSDVDGYAYIVCKKGQTSGQVLFPESDADASENFLKHGHDYSIPIEAALQFDESSGTDKIELFFSHKRIEPLATLKSMRNATTCFVAAQSKAGKDLIPDKMELGWEQPEPVIIKEGSKSSPGSNEPKTVAGELKDRSFVTIVSHEPNKVLTIEIALRHHNK